jgi:hypothetical protein
VNSKITAQRSRSQKAPQQSRPAMRDQRAGAPQGPTRRCASTRSLTLAALLRTNLRNLPPHVAVPCLLRLAVVADAARTIYSCYLLVDFGAEGDTIGASRPRPGPQARR